MSSTSPKPDPDRPRRERTLSGITRHAASLGAIRASDLEVGDTLVVRTRNSTYLLTPTLDGRFHVRGGWFERQGRFAAALTIAGCSWGGSAIASAILAAPGLFLEFGNGLRTTRIQGVELIPAPHPGSMS